MSSKPCEIAGNIISPSRCLSLASQPSAKPQNSTNSPSGKKKKIKEKSVFVAPQVSNLSSGTIQLLSAFPVSFFHDNYLRLGPILY